MPIDQSSYSSDGGLVEQLERETAQVQKAYKAAETHEGSRPVLDIVVLFFFVVFINPNSGGGIKYRYSRVDRNSRAYYNTDFHHLRVRRQRIGIVAVLRADRRRTIQRIRNSAILLTNCAGCVRVVREWQVRNDGRRAS